MDMNYSGIIALILLIVALVIFLKKYPEHDEDEEELEEVANSSNQPVATPLDINDEDATVACLIAAIEERQQSGKNVQIVSVREVK